jgi:hypothetical protein
MKSWAAYVVVLVLGAPAAAQQAGGPERRVAESGEVELLELEQDVDAALLRQAMMRLGGLAMKPAQDRERSDEARKREAEEVAVLNDFIQEKRKAFTRRAAELKNMRAGSVRQSTPRQGQPARQPNAPRDDKERQALAESLVTAQVEVELLQQQVQLYQQPLSEAVQALANAEFAAGNDEAKKGEVEAVRKRLANARERYVEVVRKLESERNKAGQLQERLGTGGMGGGVR